MATMKQIAHLAGVSRGTVDRVLNNRGIVNEETAHKVREIAQSLNYVPSKAARSLAARKLGIKLGYVLFPSSSNAFFLDVDDGIAEKAEELKEFGVTVEIAYSNFIDPTAQDQAIDDLLSRGIRGLVVCGFNTEKTAKKLSELSARGIPVITANTDIPHSGRMAYVGSDYEKTGRTAGGLMQLIAGDHAHAAIVYGSADMLCHAERAHGFQAALHERKSSIQVVATVENHDDDFESFARVNELLEMQPDINALFLASGGVYGACRAVEAMPVEKRPKIISVDCVATTAEMISKGIISATICQQPNIQGSLPLDLLFNYLCMGIAPDRVNYFTEINVVIKESM